MLSLALALAAGCLFVSGFLLLERWQQQTRVRWALDRLRETVAPYLRRKAAEAELAPPGPVPAGDARRLDTVLTELCATAEHLLALDRGDAKPSPSLELAIADTEDLRPEAIAPVAGSTTRPERPGGLKG